jgi:[amino group carrier protein]-L-2-aminoadipate 6-kinase
MPVEKTLTVVKCGGGQAVDVERVCADVAALVHAGERVVLAHGGSAEIQRLAADLGTPLRTLRGPDDTTSRHSDPAAVEVVTLALAGRVKPRLVARLGTYGVTAVGLTGLDGGLLRARRKRPPRAVVNGRAVAVHDDHSGRIVGVNTALLRTLLGAGMTPVVSPPAADRDGTVLNVDADRVAAAAAAALGAGRLVLLTGTPGLLRDVTDEDSLVGRCRLPVTGPVRLADGGMCRKLVAAREALLGGVRQVVIGDGRVACPVTSALSGAGTTIEVDERARAGAT